jgi:L-ascorbate metabolism protein UlaG (beta-lactamase superfamily)
MMRLTQWGHACVRLERDGSRLVIDPGSFSDLSVLDTADAVLVTHEHADHVVIDAVRDLIAKRSDLHVWAPGAVVDLLDGADDGTERLHAVREGDEFTAVGFRVTVVGEQHAPIHPDVPRIANVAYLVDGVVLHPGDSFTQPPAGTTRIEVLLTPVAAPWLKIGEAIDYVRAVGPRIVVPIHDAILGERGTALVDRLVTQLGGAAEYRRLGAGEELIVG